MEKELRDIQGRLIQVGDRVAAYWPKVGLKLARVVRILPKTVEVEHPWGKRKLKALRWPEDVVVLGG